MEVENREKWLGEQLGRYMYLLKYSPEEEAETFLVIQTDKELRELCEGWKVTRESAIKDGHIKPLDRNKNFARGAQIGLMFSSLLVIFVYLCALPMSSATPYLAGFFLYGMLFFINRPSSSENSYSFAQPGEWTFALDP